MNMQIRKIVGAMFCMVLAMSAAPAFAQAVPADQAAAVPAAKPSMVAAVAAAQALLHSTLDARKTKPKIVTSTNIPFNVTLAVWNRDTGTTTLVDGIRTGSRFALKTPFAYPVSVSYVNGVNTSYALPPDSHDVVVGVITPTITQIASKHRRKRYQVSDIVYVPYSNDFYTPEMLSAGSDYLSFLIKQAYDDLRARGIRSHAYPDKLVVDVIDPYLVKSIAIIEHAHTQLFQKDDPEGAVGSFLITLATNKDDAFDQSVSTAGARGLVQFIPSTYKLIVNGRKDLGLIPDFVQGMGDHKNAVKAQVALLDDDLAAMPDSIKAQYATQPGKVAEYLAAAYNGGDVRVRRALAMWGEDAWSVSRVGEINSLNTKAVRLRSDVAVLKKRVARAKKKDAPALRAQLAKASSERSQVVARLSTLKDASLREETVLYVVKLRKVYDMLAAGLFATPNAPTGALPQPPSPAPDPAAMATAPVATPPAATPPGAICFADGGCSSTSQNPS